MLLFLVLIMVVDVVVRILLSLSARAPSCTDWGHLLSRDVFVYITVLPIAAVIQMLLLPPWLYLGIKFAPLFLILLPIKVPQNQLLINVRDRSLVTFRYNQTSTVRTKGNSIQHVCWLQNVTMLWGRWTTEMCLPLSGQ